MLPLTSTMISSIHGSTVIGMWWVTNTVRQPGGRNFKTPRRSLRSDSMSREAVGSSSNNTRRILEDGPQNRQLLVLAGGKLDTPVAQVRVEALRHRVNGRIQPQKASTLAQMLCGQGSIAREIGRIGPLKKKVLCGTQDT